MKQKVDRDTTAKLKAEVNRPIEVPNYINTSDVDELDKISGEYEPSYIYGDVKIHKSNNLISTATYQFTKILNIWVNKLITQSEVPTSEVPTLTAG